MLLLLFDAEESIELSVFWWLDSNLPLTYIPISFYFFLSFFLFALRLEPLTALLLLLSEPPDDKSLPSAFLVYSVLTKPS